MERTLIILKPDSIQRGLIGAIISRFENKGLQIVGLKFAVISKQTAQEHYGIHKGKPFYDNLVRFMAGSPVVLIVLQANNAVDVARKMMGATSGFKAEPGTIRGDFGLSSSYNLIHGSDSPENAQAEIARFFSDGELFDYPAALGSWIYDQTSGKPQ